MSGLATSCLTSLWRFRTYGDIAQFSAFNKSGIPCPIGTNCLPSCQIKQWCQRLKSCSKSLVKS